LNGLFLFVSEKTAHDDLLLLREFATAFVLLLKDRQGFRDWFYGVYDYRVSTGCGWGAGAYPKGAGRAIVVSCTA